MCEMDENPGRSSVVYMAAFRSPFQLASPCPLLSSLRCTRFWSQLQIAASPPEVRVVCGETEERIQISSPSTMEFESLVLKSIALLTTALSVHLSLSPPNPPVKRDECTGSRTHTIFERLIQWITFASKVSMPFSFLGI